MTFSNFTAMIAREYFTLSKKNWQVWEQKSFRYKLLSWFAMAVALLAFLPFFFQYIEKRTGRTFEDPILNMLQPRDFSIPIFIIIWTSALLILLSFIKNAQLLLLFLAAWCLLTIFRITFIYMLPLNPPIGLIPLKDPLSNSFYGSTFITKDLFFSGHTSTLFLIFLCLEEPKFKYFSCRGTALVAFLLLLQHVHYSIDVIFAFPFAVISYVLAKKIL